MVYKIFCDSCGVELVGKLNDFDNELMVSGQILCVSCKANVKRFADTLIAKAGNVDAASEQFTADTAAQKLEAPKVTEFMEMEP